VAGRRGCNRAYPLPGQAIIYFLRGIKIALHLHSDIFSAVINAIREEQQMIEHCLHPDDKTP
jgi:hypothetical protein